ncbi:MAG: elongation factor G [Eubacteriales bacterium]|nr:elongation factor G [Eubacteriales bacterium]
MKIYPAKDIKNIAFMGHSGSGKTSVIEAMLFNAKVINRMGKTQDGNTVTDFDQEEQRRGSSIGTSYAAMEWKKNKFNLIDIPGDFDFLAEQRLGMRVADSVILVGSAKDGLSVGAEKTLRLVEHANKPAALLLNKADEPNADFAKTVAAFREEYGNKLVPLMIPIKDGDNYLGYVDIRNGKAYHYEKDGQVKEVDAPAELAAEIEQYHSELQEQIAGVDEELMMKYFDGEAFTPEEEERGLSQAMAEGNLIPIFSSSALNNQGIAQLLDFAAKFFPCAADAPPVKAKNEAGEEIELTQDPDGPLAAYVFKTIVDPFVGRISLFRVYSGTFTTENNAYNPQKHIEERISALFAMQGKKQIEVNEIRAGDIGAIAKLSETVTNDSLCLKDEPIFIKAVKMPIPCLSMAIVPAKRGEEDKIMQGMQRLMDEDPSFEIRSDRETGQLLLSGQGEVQLEVLRAKLKGKYNVESVLEEARVPYRETIRKKVKVQGRHKKQSGGHGQYGDVWIEFEPCDSEELVFEESIFGGAVPKNYFPAVEKGLQEAVVEGVLAGYPVVNLKATLVDGSYHDVDSNEMSFKLAARLAYRNGLPQADPVLLEPIASVKVHIPDNNLGDIMGDISKRRGRILGMGADEDRGYQVVEAEAPMSELTKYATDLKSMTQGRGWFTVEFARYEQAPSDVAEKVIAAAARDAEEE